ncbi:uncharacterized protein [Clytia hemisphaerica]|uniref:Uncharacterized protein n=1 Tax=Clytia hemisphaerica TaxID=252671 RepID=A0A7M5XCR6_9CNID
MADQRTNLLPGNMLAFFMAMFVLYVAKEVSAVLDDGCTKNGLGLDWYLPDDEKLPDSQITASSELPYRLAKYGRFRSPAVERIFGVWCPEKNDQKPWWQVDFLAMRTITAIRIGSNEYADGYVTRFTLHFSYDGNDWFTVKDSKTNKSKLYIGLDELWAKEQVALEFPVTARFFRIYPEMYHYQPCLQADFVGCKPEKTCNKKVGVTKSSIVPNSDMTSSTFYKNHPASSGRLDAAIQPGQSQWGAWCATTGDIAPYLQIDLRLAREISKLETQGHPYDFMQSWVTQYAFNYSLDGQLWKSYNQVLFGNIDGSTKKLNELKPPVIARYIRFLPKKWEGDLPCMRVEAYECLPRKESIPTLVYGLSDHTINRGEPLSINCLFRGLPNMTLVWNINQDYLRTSSRIITSEVTTENEASSTLFIKRVTSAENGEISCISFYPTLQDIHAKSAGTITVLAPIPELAIVNYTVADSVIHLNHSGPYTRDVLGYRVKVSSVDGVKDLDFPYNDTRLATISKLRPYVTYNLQVAMRYLEDEIGPFYSSTDFETPQDKPYGAPLNLHVTKISHDTLHATWDDPAPKLCNGPIIYYDVRYVKSDKSDPSVRSKRAVSSNVAVFKRVFNSTAVLDRLEPGAIYEVSTRSYTKVGPGPWVHPPELVFTGKATEELNSLKKMVITDANAAAVSNRLKNITADRTFLNKHDVVLTLDILEKVVNKQNTSGEIGQSLVEAVSNVLKANKTVLSESEITNRTGTRFVKMLEKWLEKLPPSEKKLEEESENVIVQKIFINKHKLEEGINFAKEDLEKSGGVEMHIPKEAIPGNGTADSIYFVYYKKNKFFNGNKRLEELCINGFTVFKERVFTPVVSGEVVGQKTRNLSAPVVLKFRHTEDEAKLRKTACAYWDYEADNEKGGWSTEGCTVESIANQTITCHCNHLTNFAAMMDVYAETSTICGKHRKIISFITVIGCFLSLIGLFLTFLTYFMFRRLLKEMAAKVLIQLCVALFIVVLTFVTGIEQTDKPVMCMTVAFVLHYFTLVSFFWMLMEASFMYHAFVRVWPPRQGGDIYKSTVVAWGIPLFIVGITFLTSMDNYGGSHYCHLTGTPLIASYLAPIGLIILINFVIFIFIMMKLGGRPNGNTDQNSLQLATARLRRAFGIMILMGLTWAFGFGQLTDARLEFSYLFSVFNASQGFSIFIFYVIAQKRARSQWIAFFKCDGRSENKRTTDSYFSERRRMSSIGSNRTNTMQFNRLGSNASSIQRNSIIGNGYPLSPPEKFISPPPMNTIDELESPTSPIRSFDDPPEFHPPPSYHSPITPMEQEQPLLAINDDTIDGILEDSLDEEDEILNKKLQESEDNRKLKQHDIKQHQKQKDIKQYSSYRALSGAKSYDVLNSVKTPSGKNLDKNTIQRRSMEVIYRKESTNRKDLANRRSLIDMSSNRLSALSSSRDQHHVTKSMEHINKKESFRSEIPSEDIGLTGYKKIGTVAHRDKNTNNRDLKNVRPLSIDTGTLKSDAATMTDAPPSYEPKISRQPSEKSKKDVMDWLQNCENENDLKDSDSDYSSSFYKTSRSSSMTDMTSPTKYRHPTASTTSNHDPYDGHKKSNTDGAIIDDFILGPLNNQTSGKDSTPNNKNNNGKQIQDILDPVGKSSDFSEEGYSASEEDVFDDHTRPPARRKSRGERSMNSFKRQLSVNGYVALEDKDGKPTSYL